MCSMVLSFTLSPAKNLQITQIQNIKIILIVTGQFAVSYWKFWVLLGFLPHLSDCLLPGHVLHSLQEFPGLVIHSFYLSPGLGTSTCQFKHYTFIIERVLGLSCIFKDVSIIINRKKNLNWNELPNYFHLHITRTVLIATAEPFISQQMFLHFRNPLSILHISYFGTTKK